MKSAGAAGKPAMIHDDNQRPRTPWVTLMLLLLFVAAAAMAAYHVYKLTAVPRLQVCDARLGPLVYNDPLNRTIAELKMNITLCWK